MRRIFYLFFVFGGILQAQIGGHSVYQFLNLSISAKQAAFGGKVFTGMNHDIFQPAYNPATLDSVMDGHLGANYVSYLGDINYGNVAYAKTFNKLGTLYAAVSYVNYGKFQYATEDGSRDGSTFSASEGALILGYSYTIPNSKFSVGASTKIILSNLRNYSSAGIAFDLGLLYRNEKSGVQYALAARNFGTQLSRYQDVKEKIPFEIDFSFSKSFAHAPFKWYFTLENLQKSKIAFVNTAHNTQDPDGEEVEENITLINHAFRHVIVGVELFPKKKINLRVGYNFRRAAELGLKDQRFSSGLSFGLGINLRKFQFNYSYGSYNYASNAGFFSVIVKLDEF